MGVQILEARPSGIDYGITKAEDVVILPAFGVTIQDFAKLREIGCVMVDTTCGSVLNVWKRVESYARDGFTSLIHGKHYHEETRATASQASKHAGAHYFVVRNMDEAREVCDFIERRVTGTALMERFAHAASPGFDPDRDFERIGVANQTTMLARESLAIGAEVGDAMARARGVEYAAANFRTFDTICSATQERQDAVVELLREPIDVMVVIGGYNSSNTISGGAVRGESAHLSHRGCVGDRPRVGRTAASAAGEQGRRRGSGLAVEAWSCQHRNDRGASTPNNKIGDAVARIFATRESAPLRSNSYDSVKCVSRVRQPVVKPVLALIMWFPKLVRCSGSTIEITAGG